MYVLNNTNNKNPRMDPSVGQERRAPVTPSSSSRYHRRRSSGSRDERYRSGERQLPPNRLHLWGVSVVTAATCTCYFHLRLKLRTL
ncbi:putative disco-interacting protein 2 -like A-like [Scophthalmus maximus]|uniref:Putative disco-interacting protein 2-like A-like n=1 Tax=Scophthalmus maximus TaxID=52904 RepID=A0A2U9BIC8_SCOMX|nr:putative disco-interacting protein 2 -like A-like [Scophthalmus maximus]